MPLYNNQQVILQSTFTVTSFELCKILKHSCHPFLRMRKPSPENLTNLPLAIQWIWDRDLHTSLLTLKSGFLLYSRSLHCCKETKAKITLIHGETCNVRGTKKNKTCKEDQWRETFWLPKGEVGRCSNGKETIRKGFMQK